MTCTPILAIRSENAPSNRCCPSQPVDEEPQVLSRLESVRSCRVAPLPGQRPRGVLLLVLPVWNPVRPGRESAREIAREGLDPVLNLACAFAAVGDGSCRGASVVVLQFAGRQDVSKVRDPPDLPRNLHQLRASSQGAFVGVKATLRPATTSASDDKIPLGSLPGIAKVGVFALVTAEWIASAGRRNIGFRRDPGGLLCDRRSRTCRSAVPRSCRRPSRYGFARARGRDSWPR